MRAVSARFLAAVAASNRMVTRVDVMRDGAVLAPLSVQAGQVTLDSSALIRGRVELSVVADADLIASDLLKPYGNELRVKRGVVHADGTEELVGLGVFGIEKGAVGSHSIALSGRDRSAKVEAARFEAPLDVAAGTQVRVAVDTVLAGAGITAGAATAITSTQTTPHLIGEEGGDRLAFVTDLCASIGLRMYFDGDGQITFRPDATAGPAVVTLSEGAGGVLLDAGYEWDGAGVYNRWIVTGENSGQAAPVRGVATDDDATSPTYYYGPFGPRPTFYQSSFITTAAQALDAAAAMKSRELGSTQRVQFGSYVNPALEPGDVVRITRVAVGIDEDHVIESLVIPLTADQPLTGTTKARQVTA